MRLLFSRKTIAREETGELTRSTKIALLLFTLLVFDAGFLLAVMHEVIRNVVIILFIVYFTATTAIMLKYKNDVAKVLIQFFPIGLLTSFFLSILDNVLNHIGILYLFYSIVLLAVFIISIAETRYLEAEQYSDLEIIRKNQEENE
ncbi:MAG: hypothetical protein ACXAEU_18860 [Candidatus Hodarchaeales archaeon]